MYVRRMQDGCLVLAPAKVNLFFEVLAKREDGFHEIETLMAPVDCFDSLMVTEDPSGQISLRCVVAEPSGAAAAALDEVPADSRNIAFRAIELLRQRAGLKCGARLHLIKRIPALAGLGGGSSDAAAVLVAANFVWKLGWPAADLARLAAELGSDVPFFIGGRLAICRGRGEIIQPVAGNCSLAVVIVRPPAGLSTPLVYRHCRPGSPPQSVEPLRQALLAGDVGRVGRLLHNRLQAPAAELSPWIGRLQTEFGRLDCLGHQMSGSGTSYFAICHNLLHARRLAARLRARNWGRTIVARCG